MTRSALLEVRSGTILDVCNPRVEDIHIEDIIHGLAHQPRFAGHTCRHLSVAEHSVNVSFLVPPEDALAGLLHDATEAYLVDVPTPIKKLFPVYYEIEAKLHGVICERFGIDPVLPASVKEADARICITEKIQLISENGLDGPGWTDLTSRFQPYELHELSLSTQTVPAWVARQNFRRRFHELTGGRYQ